MTCRYAVHRYASGELSVSNRGLFYQALSSIICGSQARLPDILLDFRLTFRARSAPPIRPRWLGLLMFCESAVVNADF